MPPGRLGWGASDATLSESLNPYKTRNIMQHTLVAHRSPPAWSEPQRTFSKFGRVGRALAR
eukprot:1127415-Prymnesium_polylepis.1